jgi:C1A family cysteine protease
MALKRGKVLSQSATRGTAPEGRRIARYGWKPDLPDQRDYSFIAPRLVLASLPQSVDLRDQCPAVYDQEYVGSCTACAIAGGIEFDMMKQGLKAFTPSRLFIYYNEREMEGSVGFDAGAYIRDGVKSVAKQGSCPESDWPYDGRIANLDGSWPPGHKAAVKPPLKCYQEALKHKALKYFSVDRNMADLKSCLAAGFPFIYGFTVYQSFESEDVKKTGDVPMPQSGESVVGGHAVLAVGYDDQERVFVCRNSWGEGWGDAGYFYMPYAYLLDDNLADDFWTIRLVE